MNDMEWKGTSLGDFLAFASMLGRPVTEKILPGPLHGVYFQLGGDRYCLDPSIYEGVDGVKHLGYDYFQFLGVFDMRGNIDEVFIVSHVVNRPDRFEYLKELILKDDKSD